MISPLPTSIFEFKGTAQNFAVYKGVCAVDFNFSVLRDVEITGISVELRLDRDSVASAAAWLVKATQTIIMRAVPRKGRIPNFFVFAQVPGTTFFGPTAIAL